MNNRDPKAFWSTYAPEVSPYLTAPLRSLKQAKADIAAKRSVMARVNRFSALPEKPQQITVHADHRTAFASIMLDAKPAQRADRAMRPYSRRVPVRSAS